MPAAARNVVHNPRPASLTNITISAGGSRTLVTDRSYSGTSSILAVIPAGGTFGWSVATAGDADLNALALGGSYNSAFHVSGPVPSGVTAVVRFTYTDATFSQTASVPVTNLGTGFERINLPEFLASATKTINAIQLIVTNTSASAVTIYIGGFDLRRQGNAIDGFVHGSAGDNYSWEGTADNSPSNRISFVVAPIIGSGGSIYPTVRLYVVNRNNKVLREITSHFIDGDVSYDMDAESWKGSCRLVLDDPTLIQPLAIEFVRIVLRLDYPDGTFEEGPLGQFMVDPPSERWNNGQDQWTYQGKDLLSVLATTMIREGWQVDAGVSYLSQIELVLLEESGLTRSQFSLPPMTQVHPANFSWEISTTALKIVTDELQAVGMQKPWVTPAGVITTAVAGTNPAKFQPSIVLATGPDSLLRWPFQVDPDMSGVGNRVQIVSSHYVQNLIWHDPIIIPAAVNTADVDYEETVEEESKKKNKKKKKKKKKPDPQPGEPEPPPPEPTVIPGYYDDGYVPTFGIAINNDPAHPISRFRLGRYIDLPDINVPLVVDQAEADNLAKQALIKASSLPIRARVTTVVMLRGLNEVYELDMMDSDGNPIPSGQGRYFCRGWQLQLGLPWEMVHTLTRVIDFKATSFFG